MEKGLKKKNLMEEVRTRKELIKSASEKILQVQVSFPINNGRNRCDETGEEVELFFQIALEALKKQEELYAYHVERGLCPHCSKPVSQALRRGGKPKIFCCPNHSKNYTGRGRAEKIRTPGETPDFRAILNNRKTKLQRAVLKIEIPDFDEEEKIVTVFLGKDKDEKIEYGLPSKLEIQWHLAWEAKTNGGELEAISDFKKKVESELEVFFTLESYILEEELHKMTRIDSKGLKIWDYVKACFLKKQLLPIEKIAKAEAENRQKEHKKIDAEIAEKTKVADRKKLIEPLMEEEDETAAADAAYLAAIEAERLSGKRVVPVGRAV